MKLNTCNWFMYFATVVVNLFSFTVGCLLCWNSPVLPKLQSTDSGINPLGSPISTIESSIGLSVVPVGSIIGTALVGKIAEMFGRKRILVYVSVSAVISFGSMVFVKNIYVYFVLLTFATISTSSGFVIVPVYVTEIAQDGNRGKLGCFGAISVTLGQIYTYLLGPVTSLGVFSILCGLPSLLFLMLSIFLPESPVFLASKGHKTAALKALKKLKQNKTLSELGKEYNEREKMLKESPEDDFGILFRTRYGRKSFLLSIVLRITQQLSGMFVILSIMGPLFQESGSTISADTMTVVVATANLLAAILALNIIERQGRRFLLLLAYFFDGLSMVVLGIYFVFKENDLVELSASLRVLPIVCVLVFVVMFTLGLANVPFIVISEILPNEVRSVGSSLVLVTGNLSMFATSFAYPIVSRYLGTYFCMFTFSCFCFFGFFFVYFLLPETKGKSFAQIQKELEK